MNLKPQQRQFSPQKLLLLLIFALKYQPDEKSIRYDTYFQTDLAFCTKCFQSQKEICRQIFSELEPTDDFSLLGLFYFMPAIGRRDINLLNLKNKNTKVVAKYLAKGKSLHALTLNQVELAKGFHNKARLDGLQFCPEESLQRFIGLFKPSHNEITIWLYLAVNVQPLLMTYLEAKGGFPIPETYATCGFSLFQRYAGKSLINFYSSNFYLKLKIAKKLLKAALKFTEGFDGFRVYITDLNVDNIVYDPTLNRLKFVDLDTVLIVDSQNASLKTTIHQHQYIECIDCFAYSPTDICQSQTSDINIFSSCQLLREDLKKDITKGFLYPIPETYSSLTLKLNNCLDCPSLTCKNRFDAAVDLINYIDEILL